MCTSNSIDESERLPEAAAILCVYLRGCVRFKTADGRDIHISSAKGRALLAFLCVHEAGTVTRQELIKLFWPLSEAAQARSSLREELRNVRKALAAAGIAIVSGPSGTLALATQTVWIDTSHELAALRDTGVRDCEADQLHSELYGDLKDLTSEFAEWRDEQRAIHEQRILQALRDYLAKFQIDGGDRGGRLKATHALFMADLTAEAVCRDLMLLLKEAGEFAEAQKVFDRHATVMSSKLEIPPSQQTRMVLEGIRAHARALTPRAAPQHVQVAAPSLLQGHGKQHPASSVTLQPQRDEAILVGVSPVRNMTADAALDFMAASLTEDIITDLVMLLGPFSVIELPPAVHATAVQPPSTCKYVIMQSLQNGVVNGTPVMRLNSRLCRSPGATAVSAYRDELAINRLQENHTAITNRIASKIRLDLIMDVGRRLGDVAIDGLSTSELVVKGLSLLRMRNTKANLTAAKTYFAAGLVRNPHSADALAGLGHVCHRMATQPAFSDTPREDAKNGRAVVDAALEIDPGHVMANYVSGMLRSVEGDPEGASAAFDSIMARTHYAPAAGYGGYNRVFMDQPKSGLKSLEHLIEKLPHDTSLPIYSFFAGVAEFHCGNYSNARGWLGKSLTYDPNFSNARMWLAGSEYLDGRPREASKSLAAFQANSPGYTMVNFEANWGAARSKNKNYLSRTNKLAGVLEALTLPQV